MRANEKRRRPAGKRPERPSKTRKAPDSNRTAARITGWKKWGLRLLLAFLVPLLVVGLVEGALRLFGYGYDPSYFIKAEDRDVWLSNPKFSWWFFPPEIARDTIPTVVSKAEPAGTYRIFVFGGSAAQGVPNAAFSFARILEAMLNDRFPETRFEVINTGMTAINSHVVLPIVRDCREFDGDLYVMYLGNNEVVGPYGAGTVVGRFNPSLRAIRAGIRLRPTRFGQLLVDTVRAFTGDRAHPREWRGMEMFISNHVTTDDPRLQAVYDNFRANLEDICAEGRKAGAQVIVSTVLTNLKDCPPFASVHARGLSDDDKTRWEELYNAGIRLQNAAQHEKAIARYNAAREIDDRFAELHFRLGQCRLALKQFDAAREDFVQARDLDALRFRADTHINEIIRAVAGHREEESIYLTDAERIIGANGSAPHGICGSELLYEHVHPKFDGNYALAAAIFETMCRLSPGTVRESATGRMDPPSLDRCKTLTTFTAFDRFNAANTMFVLTSKPPFPVGQARAFKREAERLKATLTAQALERVAAEYRAALERRPDDLFKRTSLATVLTFRKDHASALREWRAVLDRYPHDTRVRYNLALSLSRQNKGAEALTELRRLLREWPTGEFLVRKALGAALLKTDKTDEAIDQYEKAVSIRPDDAAVRAELGGALLRAEEPAQAQEHFEAAVRIEPDSARFHHDLGVALSRQSKTKRALAAFRRAVELDPDFALSHYGLAKTSYRLGQLEQARIHYRRAVVLDPRFSKPPFNELEAALGQQHAPR